jgi:hypothetical protein
VRLIQKRHFCCTDDLAREIKALLRESEHRVGAEGVIPIHFRSPGVIAKPRVVAGLMSGMTELHFFGFIAQGRGFHATPFFC